MTVLCHKGYEAMAMEGGIGSKVRGRSAKPNRAGGRWVMRLWCCDSMTHVLSFLAPGLRVASLQAIN